MDRRQKKSRDAIFQAFMALLEHKHYSNITVQEIIDMANVGRSTFYAHFETKEKLLEDMCNEIFEHVLSHELFKEGSHDFSQTERTLEETLVHFMYHLKDNKGNILKLLSGDSSEIFMEYFKGILRKIFAEYPISKAKQVPEDFVVVFLAGSFMETINWWIKYRASKTPEEVVSLYMSML